MSIVKNGTLQVIGASIYYEVRGSGPILLLIHGGGGDADKFHNVADHLAKWYTVVTYDRRGHSRSNLVNKNEDYHVHTHSEDAHRLLANLTNEPAYVFGSSSGAVIGLDLCIRHPEQVQLLIPHEPVLLQLLPENELKQAINFMENLKGNHQSEVMKLLSNIDDSNSEPSKDMLTERLLGNSMYFTEYEIPGILSYTLNIDALKSLLKPASIQVLPAGGSISRESFPYHCAFNLAEHLGTEFAEFPGHHVGYNTVYHKEFAERLHDVIEN
ncbi:alpha/beta hydrolase fold family protein [Bacillus cereus ATCC 4342]|uniref:alpha/beta fold hydrolase n=1 Tax=Bacillus tropicus TaxID=2026188 RepID=UPI0002F23D71|nr:alpha/beta hydrolase [Bacillus tropicus]AJH76405.1 alpha/beta hydrolase family protein [Bacillus cereus ATCC 4342]KFM92510.1 alpha/beta hydrolase fold family protein [Bacillus cereus ATCC 4342]MDR4458017.1 alpha/beta hydrolase [Bacillus tropicus]QKH54726.1 alpha/beta hydrolase [Bacillus tropicus]